MTSSVCFYCIIHTTLLLVIANGAPILINNVLGKRWAWPVDNHLKLPDGNRLFGNTKTWRGCCSAIIFTILAAVLSGFPALTGLFFGFLTMIGDLLASFIKRRMGRTESSRARGFDTVPESLLPILLLKTPLALRFSDIILIVFVFFIIEELISPILYRLHIRKQPF